MEEKVIYHFCHKHPLILTENVGDYKETLYCYGCRKPVISELAYVCSQQYCSNATILHKKCAEMPRQILHPSHPQHPLHLFDYQETKYECDLCDRPFGRMLGYQCRSCNFDIEISCQQLGCTDLLEEKRLQHPSHHHPLTLMRKPAFLFFCDGCGTEDWDMAYICSTCEFWIHKTCASLPITIPKNHHHHHQLSLAFCFPIEYHNFRYNCDICYKGVLMTCWVYYCGECKYFAHVKCATSEATEEIIPAESNLNTEENDGSLIQFPVRDFSKELITPFIIKENGFDKIPDINVLPSFVIMPKTTASLSLLFNYHEHPLSLVSLSDKYEDHHRNMIMEEGPAAELIMMICDVCITPIYSPPYYHCATCNKYFVHSTCFLLPKTLSCPDSQLYGDCLPTCENHKLTACTSPELDYHGLLRCQLCENRKLTACKLDNYSLLLCHLCKFYTNGMVYECEDCKLRIDVKCASLPATIKHASHQQHKLMRRRISDEELYRLIYCDGCGFIIHENLIYYCTSDGCGFVLHLSCVLLPQTIKNEWDKHPLLLTYDASIDHPSDFYCEICEGEMHPKRWVYHCRECDHSFHILCLTATGRFKNIKFGRQFEFSDHLHPHPLTYDQVTLKLRCDTCHRNVYRGLGFECASCNYVVCDKCGLRGLNKI